MSNAYTDDDEVPLDVVQALAEHDATLSHQKPLLSPTQDPKFAETEQVVFCEPSKFRNGLCIPFILLAFEGNLVFAVLSVYLEQKLNNKLYLLVILAWIPFLWVLMIAFKWRFFGYRVVTTNRIAIVIPKKNRWIVPPGVSSSYFKDALFALARGDLTRKHACVTVQTSFIAKLEYGEGRDGHGTAMINGVRDTIPFGYVRDIQKLEEVLMIGTEVHIGKLARNTQFEYRVEYSESCFEFAMILEATFHALIFAIFGFILAFIIVSGGYSLPNIVLLADIGTVTVICVICIFTFPGGHKLGTNQKVIIGKMNYFHK